MKRFNQLNDTDPWWLILLKVIAYAIGLIIGGLGTVEAAKGMGLM